jgi:hypothetical protein
MKGEENKALFNPSIPRELRLPPPKNYRVCAPSHREIRGLDVPAHCRWALRDLDTRARRLGAESVPR